MVDNNTCEVEDFEPHDIGYIEDLCDHIKRCELFTKWFYIYEYNPEILDGFCDFCGGCANRKPDIIEGTCGRLCCEHYNHFLKLLPIIKTNIIISEFNLNEYYFQYCENVMIEEIEIESEEY